MKVKIHSSLYLFITLSFVQYDKEGYFKYSNEAVSLRGHVQDDSLLHEEAPLSHPVRQRKG